MQNSVQYFSGGWVIDDVSTRVSIRGGEAGGVAGMAPGGHTGRCLLGIGAGVLWEVVLSVKCFEDVELCPSIGGALATAAAIVAIAVLKVQLKARDAKY